MSLFDPPERMPEIWAINDAGTTSWFLEPISACTDQEGGCTSRQRRAQGAERAKEASGQRTYGCEDPELIGGNVPEVGSVELHAGRAESWGSLGPR